MDGPIIIRIVSGLLFVIVLVIRIVSGSFFCHRAGRPCPAPPLSGELTRKVLS